MKLAAIEQFPLDLYARSEPDGRHQRQREGDVEPGLLLLDRIACTLLTGNCACIGIS